MTTSAIAFTDDTNTEEAAKELIAQIDNKIDNKTPNIILLFSSPVYDHSLLLKKLKERYPNTEIVGGSSAGEFTSKKLGNNSSSAVAIFSDEIVFSTGFAVGIKDSRENVAEQLAQSMKGVNNYSYRYHSALIFADALSGYTDDLVELMTEKTSGMYQFFGGGAGDNTNFKKTYVFYNETVATDAAVICEMLSNKPIGIGVGHGWKPKGKKMKVTEADGMRLISLNAIPAAEVFADFARETDQNYDPQNPIPFFLNNVLGFETSNGYKIRCPLSVFEHGSIMLASDIPVGATVSFMSSDSLNTQEAAMMATKSALASLSNHTPSVALFFDCVATRLRLGQEFSFELDKVQDVLKPTNYIGCNTYGQVARVRGQFSGFQNCNAVVCIIPE